MQITFEIPKPPSLKIVTIDELKVGEWFIIATSNTDLSHEDFKRSINNKFFGFVSKINNGKSIIAYEVCKRTGHVCAEKELDLNHHVFPLDISFVARPQFA